MWKTVNSGSFEVLDSSVYAFLELFLIYLSLILEQNLRMSFGTTFFILKPDCEDFGSRFWSSTAFIETKVFLAMFIFGAGLPLSRIVYYELLYRLSGNGLTYLRFIPSLEGGAVSAF